MTTCDNCDLIKLTSVCEACPRKDKVEKVVLLKVKEDDGDGKSEEAE